MIIDWIRGCSIEVIYTNHREETSIRKISPISLHWGSNEWHKEPQWLMDATDLDNEKFRTFALKDMKPA